MTIIERHYPAWKDLHIHESSPNRGGRLERDCKHYLASQFFPGRPFGEVFDGYRNEDLERQTFPDRRSTSSSRRTSWSTSTTHSPPSAKLRAL